MVFLSKTIKRLLAAVVVLAVLWAFFDYGRRFVEHRHDLAERPIELTVMHWGNPPEDKIVADLVERFENEHKDVRVVRINAGGDFQSKLKTMMAANSAPDVFYLPPNMMPELATSRLIAPLDDYVEHEPAEWKADFWPILLDAFHYDPASGMIGRGKLYGLPKDFSTFVFYINVDLFEKAGIDWRAIQKNGWDWPAFEAGMKKIRALNAQPEFKGRDVFGTMLFGGVSGLRNLTWTFGGDLFKTKPDGTIDFTQLALADPPAQQAMDVFRRTRLVDHTAFNATGIAKEGGQEFLNGNIGCIGPVGHWMVPLYRTLTNFKWDMVPLPKGTVNASDSAYTGWSMSSKSKYPKESYELIRFLCGREGQIQQGEAGLSIPALQSVARSDHFLKPAGQPARNEKVFLDAVAHNRLPQTPKQTEFEQVIESATNLAVVAGRVFNEEAAERAQADWTHELNAPLRAKEWPVMPWGLVLTVVAALLVFGIGGLWIKARREKLGPIDRAGERAGYAFILPWLIGFAVFTLGPMIVSLMLAFSQWTGLVPLGEARFVGIANFRQLLTYDPLFVQSLKVTAYFVIIGVPVSQVAALAIAMLMNTRVRGIAFFRTVYFVPSVVSGAALAVLWLQLFNDQYGLINAILRPVARLFGTNPPNWFGYDTSAGVSVNDAARWAVPGFVLMGLWGVGSGMLIYLAGLKGINASVYEAARIDGAGPIRRTWNVTIPMLSPLIFYNLIMGIIGSFQIFTQAYMMTDPNGNENATLFYVLNLYRQAFQYHRMGYASAMAWVLFLIVLVLTLFVFKGSKKLVYYEGLK